MGLFKKEKKNEEENYEGNEKNKNKSKNISKNIYNVYLKEKVGNTVATFATIQCKRWFEENSEIPFLRNDKFGFLEIMPEQNIDYLNLDESKIDKEIQSLKDKLEKIKNINDPAKIMEEYGNPKNYEFKLVTLEAKKRALKYDSRSYMTFGQDGEKEYTFLREGSHFIPQAVDPDTYTAFYPPDSKKKTFAFTHRNKQEKHGMGKKFMSGALMAAWIFGIIFLFGTGYLFMQSYQSYTSSEIVKARVECATAAEDLVSNIEIQSNAITKIYEEVANKLQEPTVVIEGIKPQ